jgi:hypothetical protein
LYESGSSLQQPYTSLKTLVLGSNIKIIKQDAFRYCSSLTSVTIGNSVTTLEQDVFNGCQNLTSIIIGNSVTDIGGGAISHCTSLKSIIIPNSVTTLHGAAFWGCTALESVIIGSKVTTIWGDAFWDCTALTDITFLETASLWFDGVTVFGWGSHDIEPTSSYTQQVTLHLPTWASGYNTDTGTWGYPEWQWREIWVGSNKVYPTA